MSPRFRCFALPAALTFAVFNLSSCDSNERGVEATRPDSLIPLTQAVIMPVDLRCEGKISPLAAPKKPQLNWRIAADDHRGVRQSAWQILVASSPELLDKNQGDLWDSGKTKSERSPLISYAGKALEAGQSCHWKVRIWDQDNHESDWSEAATFEVAPASPEDWAGAQWIYDGKQNPTRDEDFYKLDPAPLFRKAFTLDKPVQSARLHVVGLGLCLPSLNGERLDDHILDPPWTDFTKRIFFRTHDVSAQIKEGENCLGLEVGNGFHNPLPLRKWGRRNLRNDLTVGRPRVIANLTIQHPDGTSTVITTGEGWKFTEGPSLRNNIYIGEIRDARKAVSGWNTAGFDDTNWKPAALSDASLAPLQPLRMLPVRPRETLKAAKLTEPKTGTWIVDYGINFTGIPEIDLNVPAGTEITLRYGELIHDDGTLNPMTSVTGQIKNNITLPDGTIQSIGGPGAPEIAWQEDTYIAKGGGETYRPDFTYHSFRFMEVTGLAEPPQIADFRAIPFNTELPQAGTFESSNELFNRIQQVCLNTFHANVVAVQSDCPHRERFGYGGDIVATSETFLMNFDMNGFYTKTVRDWGDAQLENGLMPDTAPYAGVKYCGVGWGMVHPLLIEQLYQHYGNLHLLKEQLPAALEWIAAEANRREHGLVTIGLGDHEALIAEKMGPELKTPKFIDSCHRIARLAQIAGNHEAANRCRSWAAESQAAWEKAFLDKQSGKVGVAKQTQQVFALGFGAATEQTEDAIFLQLVADLTKAEGSPRLTTGIYGTWKLLEQLPKHGRNDLAYSLANRKTVPSWGWMLENGATTLWEHWEGSDNTFSNNHPMFGSVSGWFYRWLGGIQCAPDAVGFDRILIKPMPVDGLEWVKTSHESIRGTIVSNWQRQGDAIEYEITVPPNSKAIITLPCANAHEVTESGKLIDGPDFRIIEMERGHLTLEVGSGSYRFTCQ